jgi:hypothetical protein
MYCGETGIGLGICQIVLKRFFKVLQLDNKVSQLVLHRVHETLLAGAERAISLRLIGISFVLP